MRFCKTRFEGSRIAYGHHTRELRAEGESEQRLYLLSAWRECPFCSDHERAALAWTEAVTSLAARNVSDDVYKLARSQFDERDLVNLTMAVVAINSANRINIAFRTVPCDYQPPKRRVAT